MAFIALVGLTLYVLGCMAIIVANSKVVGFLSGALGICLFALAGQVEANQQLDLDHKTFINFCATSHDIDECEEVWRMVINHRKG